MDTELQKARSLCRKIARNTGQAVFYKDKKREVDSSRRLYISADIIKECLDLVRERKDCLGHGLVHVRKVAIDAGAICLAEKSHIIDKSELRRIVFLAHAAGVLHDIRRLEKNHARVSAEESGKLLKRFDLSQKEIEAVTGAIGNHEAFQPTVGLIDPMAQFLSDALYDADKFRWGPDNFTDMIWDMVEFRKVPLDALLKRFMKGMEGVERIRGTFRTDTGRRYGPDFIDRGIKIGTEFYNIMVREGKI